MSRWKRSLSLMLALLMIFTSVPLPVFAAEEPICAAHTEHDAACGYADAVAGTPCTHTCGENCPVKEVTVCVHDHTASGCTYTEPKEAVYCGHTCGDGSCSYKAAVAGAECTCGAESHTEDCGYAEGQAEVPCDFTHSGCGCAEAVTGGWNCGHVCTVDSGCVTEVCAHSCPNDGCGYTAYQPAKACEHTCGVCELQKLIDALPAQVTAENLETVTAQLTAIDQAKAKLTDAEMELVDFTRYQNAVSAISVLSNQPAAEEPEKADIVTGKCGDNLSWEFNTTTGVLTVTGTGAMAELGVNTSYPWYEYFDETKAIVIGEGITHIAKHAFATYVDETQMTSLTLPSTLKSIGYNAFYGSAELTSLTLPQKLETIGGYAFGQCNSLKSLVIPDSVTTIDDQAFVGCEYLTTITVGKGLKNVGINVFNCIYGLRYLTVSSENPYFTALDNVLYTKDMTELVAYSRDKGVSSFTVPASVTKIRSRAFWRPYSLSTVTFTGSAPAFEENCFGNTTLEIHYDSTKSGWSSVVPNQYGGTITWVAESSTGSILTGKTGDDLTWTLKTATGAFYVTGTGRMEYYDFTESEYTPWHNYRSYIKHVAIGEGITSVGGYNFSGCTNLASVSLPSTLESIGFCSFSGCSALKSIVLPKNLYTIGERAFSGAGLTSVTIPDSVGEIKHYAFQQCTSLTEVTFGKGLHTIGGNVFFYCTALRKATFTGSAPWAPDNDIFSRCTNVTAIYPAGDTSWTEAKRSDVSTNATWKTDCDHTGETTYVDNADGLTHSKTCANCGTVLTEKENHTFDANYLCVCGTGKCGDNLTWRLSSTGVLTISGTGAMYDFSMNRENGLNQAPWFNYYSDITSVVIESGATSIGSEAFLAGVGVSKITSVSIPGTVKTIGSKAFAWCEKLTSVTLPAGVTTVGTEAFWYAGLTSATLPNTLTSIGERAFYQSDLRSVNIPGSVKTIGKEAFWGTDLRYGLTLNSGLESIGDAAFGFSDIRSVEIPDSVVTLGEGVFDSCSYMSSVTLPRGLKEIPAKTFLNCVKLTRITIPNSVTTIGYEAFCNTYITSFTLPEGLTTIDEKAFYYSEEFTEIVIPKTVTSIGNSAFATTSLNKVTFLGDPPTIGSNSFSGVKADVYYYDTGKWDSTNKLQYGGTLNWIGMDPCEKGHTYVYTNQFNGKHVKTCKYGDITSVTEDHTYVSGVCACGQAISGNCGENATWSYNPSTQLLTISGTGAMYDYLYSTRNAGWVADKTPGWYGLPLTDVTVSSGITVVGNYAFYKMPLGTVKLANSVTEVGDYAFAGTSAYIMNSQGLTAVGDSGFSGTTVSMVYKPITVGKSAFSSAKFKHGVVVVNGTVSEYAFYNSGVTTLILTDNVRYVRSYSLSACAELTEVYFCGEEPDFANDTFNLGAVDVERTFYRSSHTEPFQRLNTEIWPDEEHASVKGTPVGATCTEAGYTPYTCPYCSFTVKTAEVAAQGHSYTYTADDTAKTVTVGCGSCDLEVVFTLKAPASLDYTGQPIEATVTGEGEDMTPTVTYTGPTTDGKPVGGGEYTATMTLGGKSVSISFTVVGSAVASVTVGDTTTEYLGLSEAVAAANAAPGSIVKLLTNVTVTAPVVITGDVRMDLNGCKLSNNAAAAIEVSSGAKLRITDTGSNGTVLGMGSDGGAIVNRGTLEVNAGTLTGKYALTSSGTVTFNGGTVSAPVNLTGGSVTVNGGTFDAQFVKGSAEVTLMGGYFSKGLKSDGNIGAMLAEGYAFFGTDDQTVDGSFTETDLELLVLPSDNRYVVSHTVGYTMTLYHNLDEAIARAEILGGEVGIWSDITNRDTPIIIDSGNFRFNLQGKTISGNVSSGALLQITGANVNVKSTNATGGYMDGGALVNTGSGSAISVTDGSLSLDSGTFQSGGDAIVSNNSNFSTWVLGSAVLNIVSTSGTALVHQGSGVYASIRGGTFKGITAGIQKTDGLLMLYNVDMAVSKGPDFCLENSAYISLESSTDTTGAYTVKTVNKPASNYFASVDSYQEGTFVPYESGYYVECSSSNYLYLKPLDAPNASFDFASETLTGLVPGERYIINGAAYTASSQGTVPIQELWYGNTVTVVKAASGAASDSPAQKLSIPGRPDAPAGVTAVGESVSGKNDGSITGLTTAMQIRYPGQETWSAVDAQTLNGLAPGNYEIRLAATDSSFAGKRAIVTVDKGHVLAYTADDTADTITVHCEECDFSGVFTLAAPQSLTYTGSAIEATVTGEVEGVDAPAVTYTGSLTDGKPVNVGSYTATMTLGGQSVSLTFVIAKYAASVTADGVTTEYARLEDAVAAANAAKSATLTLLSDISTTATVVITGDVTLDLNGHKLSNGSNTAIEVSSGAKLTVNDSASGGSIYGEVSYGQFTGGAINNKGTLVLNAGSLSADGTNTPCSVVNSGSFTMNGGTLGGKNSLSANSGTMVFNGGKIAAKMAVTGGTMIFNDGDFTALDSVNGYIRGADVTIYGGTFGSINFNSPGATVNVYGGTFNAQFVEGTADVTLYGGTFKKGLRGTYTNITNMLAEGYSFFDVDGKASNPFTYVTTDYYTVRPTDNQYAVSHKLDSVTTNYYSLEAGIAQAERLGGTLTLMKNITVTAPVKINSGDFDFSSGRYTLSGSLSGGVIEVSGATVEFVANTGGLIQNTGTGSAISVTNGHVVLYSGNIQASGNAVTGKNSIVSVHPYVEVISTGAAAIYSDGEEEGVILSGGMLQGVTAAVEAESGAVIFSKAVNDLSASSGPMILLHSNARIAVQVKMNASTGYTVKLATETGIGRFGSSMDPFHVDGCFAPYEDGLYVEYADRNLYLRKETKPNGSIDFFNEKIVGLKPNTAYRITGHDYDIVTDNSGALTIYEEWMGTEIAITEQYVSGARPQTLAIPERPDSPTGISIQNESTVGKNDGALIGVNPALEYRQDLVSVPSPWVKITGTSLENLAPGSYAVRVAATESSFAGNSMGYGILRGTYSAEHFDVTAPADSVYDNTAKKAAVEYPDDLEAQNVKVIYNNESGSVEAAVDAGTYTFTIWVSDPIHGEYTLTDDAWTFAIAKRTVEILDVEISDQTFTGQGLSPDAKVTFGNLPSGCSMELLRDYTLTYSNSVDAGTATCTVEPVDTSNYTFQKKDFTFTIQPCPVRVDFFLLETTKIYSGLEKKPTPSIRWYDVPEGLSLVQGTDYTITFANNINVGTATVTLAPIAGSNFTFETKVVEFTIMPAFVTANVTEIADQDYTGRPIEPKVTVKFSGAFLNEKPVLDKDYTVTYLDNINAGTATVVIAPVEGGNITFTPKEFQFSILPCKAMVVVKHIEPQTYTGKPIVPEVNLVFTKKTGEPLTLVENVDYTMTITDNINVGAALITVKPVEGSNYDVTFTRGGFQIDPCVVTATVTSPGKLAYTGLELCPDIALTFTGVPEGCVLEVGKDYTVEYRDNVAVTDSATATVKGVEGSNFTFTQTDTTFSICYGVQLPELRDQVYVDGVPYEVESDGFLWLDHENHKMITWYDLANNGDPDIHKVYPTSMHVAELSFSEIGGYMAKRVTELDNTLQYSGTSIRITGNQGIRFITSIPNAKKSALTGSGLAGFQLVEYGTLMGWYEPGTELLYGVNAKSVAYDRASGTDQVFNKTGDLVQFTGMLTNLELDQSTRDLRTRPYMVLERTNAEGETEQVVLYGGSITRSIGYVALQNKDVFKPGTASYKFIWNILSYAYPDLYEAEYQG